MSVKTWARSVIGKKGLGLYSQPRTTKDRVWLAAEGTRETDAARLAAEPLRAEGYVTLEPYAPPIGDQGATSSCVGEMAHGLVAIVEAVHGLPYDPISPRAAYLQSVLTHTPQNAPPEDSGTYIRACLSEIRKKGCATLAEWKRSTMHVLKPVPAPLRAHGYNRRGLEYEFIVRFSLADELDAVDAAIRMHRPVGFGWQVTERYVNHRGALPYDARLRKSDRQLGGHAQLQTTTRDEQGIVRLRNSWGTGWGDRGYVNVIADTMTRRDIVLVRGWERLSVAS